jgi:hypothetical protein
MTDVNTKIVIRLKHCFILLYKSIIVSYRLFFMLHGFRLTKNGFLFVVPVEMVPDF